MQTILFVPWNTIWHDVDDYKLFGREYSDNLILALLKKLPHIDVEHYIKTLMSKDRNSILTILVAIQELIKQFRGIGYGKPEQYNQLFYFIVRHSINLIKRILEE